jgi:nicotinamide mononucleotide transporter PnuC
VVLASNVAVGVTDFLTLMDTLLGVTALIFIAKGNVWGQILTVAFSVLYAVTSFKCHYYGEVITYLGMTMPIAMLSIVTWLRHPYAGSDGEVEISKLDRKRATIMILACIAVTVTFYYVLKYFDTPNLTFSTMSITTSFLASYLMLCRNSYYALAYSLNDIVLIVLWVLATFQDLSHLPMVACFGIFFINDLYGFISWKHREVSQRENSK